MEKIKKFNIGYTQVCNKILQDNRISLKAKGLYAYLFSKPDNWVFKIKIMLSELKDGRDSIYSGLNELITHGYILRKQINNGSFGGVIYEFLNPFSVDNPVDNPVDKSVDNLVDKSVDKSVTCTENPCTENPTHNNKYNNKYIYKYISDEIFIDDNFTIGGNILFSNYYNLVSQDVLDSIRNWIYRNFKGGFVSSDFVIGLIFKFSGENQNGLLFSK